MTRLTLTLMFGLGLLALSCADSVTLGEYLAEMDSLRARLEEELTVQRSQLEAIHQEGDPFTEQERAEHDRERILYFVRVMRETSLEVEKVEPAAEAEGAHEAYITAIEGFVAAFEATITDETYHEMFSDPHVRDIRAYSAEGPTLVQIEDSVMSFDSLPSLREAESDMANACGELREIAFSYYEDHPEDGILERPC